MQQVSRPRQNYTFMKVGMNAWKTQHFLGAFTKLGKATVDYVIFVSPSLFLFVCMKQLGFHGTDVHEIWYLIASQKCV